MDKLLLKHPNEPPGDEGTCNISDRYVVNFYSSCLCLSAALNIHLLVGLQHIIRSATLSGSPTTLRMNFFTLSVCVGSPSSPAASLVCINCCRSPSCCTKIAWLRSTRNFFQRGCSAFISRPMHSIKCIASSLTENLDRLQQ